VLTQDCTNKDEFSSQENTLFKKMAKTGIRHIAEKSADIIDPVQKQKFRKKQKKRTNQRFRNPKTKKSENRNTNQRNLPKGYIIRHAYLQR
jgi:hypothetical protein